MFWGRVCWRRLIRKRPTGWLTGTSIEKSIAPLRKFRCRTAAVRAGCSWPVMRRISCRPPGRKGSSRGWRCVVSSQALTPSSPTRRGRARHLLRAGPGADLEGGAVLLVDDQPAPPVRSACALRAADAGCGICLSGRLACGARQHGGELCRPALLRAGSDSRQCRSQIGHRSSGCSSPTESLTSASPTPISARASGVKR